MRLRAACVTTYPRMARMAFLLGASNLDRQARAGRAHRLARRVLPHWPGPRLAGEEAARALLARLIRAGLRGSDLPRSERAPLAWRAVPAPPGDGHAAIDIALAGVGAAARAGYGLLVG